MKLTAFAWNYYDGGKKENDLPPSSRRQAIRTFPNILEFFGFVFFFGGFLVGPSFQFNDYVQFVKKEGPFANYPSTFIPAMKTLIIALICQFIFTKFNHWNFDWCLTSEYQSLPFVLRAGYLWVAGVKTRMKYYTAWKMAEGACILSGLGWNGYDENSNPQW